MTSAGAVVGPAVNAVGNSKYFISVILLVPLIGTAFAISLLLQGGIRFSDLALLAAMYVMTGFGLTIGFHRLLTHRSFQTYPAVKIILLILGSMGVAGPPIAWAAAHIKHHSRPDLEGDPHSPMEGIFHAHVGWLFKNRFPDAEIYCPHLLADSSAVFVNRTFLLWVALSFAIPFMIGGWTGLLWGGIVRVFISHHTMFCVNSVCHAFGSREFETNDCSRNQWIVGLLALGEGWHNNHHAFPRSAFHGFHWWQIDLSGYVIWALERLGLIYDVYRVSPAALQRSSAFKARLASSPIFQEES